MEAPRIDFPAIFAEATLGDQHALEFLRTFLHWVHLIDDVIDGESPGSGEYVILVNLELLRVMSFNPFWDKHKLSLFPIILQAARAFADSNNWAKRADFRDRASADVLKSQYQDVWFHVAFLCGGYAHMCRVSERYRIYDYDSTGLMPASTYDLSAPAVRQQPGIGPVHVEPIYEPGSPAGTGTAAEHAPGPAAGQ